MDWLLAASTINKTWFIIPLVLVISLVYQTSRYELPAKILQRTVRMFLQITACLAIAFAALFWLSSGL